MSKYNVDDKVVIRKDLVVDEFYNGMYWLEEMEYLKEKDYVVIYESCPVGDYYVDDWYITEEMISHKYEESGNKYNKGDKVVIRKDLVVGEYYGDITWRERKEYMKELDYVVIKEADEDGDYLVEGGIITDEMISHKYDEKYETEKPNLKGSINDNIEYKVDDPILFDSITSFHIDSLINKALEENNTEMLLEISEYMKGGEHIDIT